MASAATALLGRTGDRDIALGEVPAEALGSAIVQNLSLKGFCTISTGLLEGVIDKCLGDVKDLDAAQRFRGLHPLILDGLLGNRGSARVAELELPDVDEAMRTDGETLRALDHTITDVGLLLEPFLPRIGVDMSHRSLAIVHETGLVQDDRAALSEKEVQKWLTQFLRYKIMVVIFLGPTEGVLELWPHGIHDAEPYKVATTPGSMVVLRPDVLGRNHSAPGRSVALSSYFLQGAMPRSASGRETELTPEVRALDDWMVSRLEDIKREETEHSMWDERVLPREWQRAMNHLFHKGQMIAVRGVACRFPHADDPETFFKASVGGPDYVIEVPHIRWDHSEVYDPDPESWKNYKSYCKHAAFMEGVDQFDCKFFGISPNEVKSMDPNQRLVLEVGYSALHSMGMRKRTLLNAQCGVYVGNGVCEWNYVPRPADFGAFGATGGSLSITAGRFSFVLGLKGPSMVLDTEASSGLTATYMAVESVQRKGRTQPSDFSIAMGVHLCLAALWWPAHCASGWLCREGRCFTFDASAAGYVRGEGCAAITVKPLTEVVNGEVVSKNDDASTLIGCIAGAMMNSNGRSANLAAPYGPAEQMAICEAIRSARLSPLDVDAVEVHGSGALLADAVEVGSMLRAHRNEVHPDPLCLLATKTSVGNQVECGGITSLLKSIYSARWGVMTPNLHLRVCNPHIDVWEEPALLPTEALEHRATSAFTGVMSRGFGGSNVYVLTWGESGQDQSTAPALANGESQALEASRSSIKFWPGGGGALERRMKPQSGYTVVGSWNRWSSSDPMDDEGNGVYGYTVTLGENRWERFQIWLDGDRNRALHPGRPKASKDAPVFGPADEATSSGKTWIIDGRTDYLVSKASDRDGTIRDASEVRQPRRVPMVSVPTADTGQPGDQYRVRLRVSGRWRAVDWEKLPAVGDRPSVQRGRYYLCASWTDWHLQEMELVDPSSSSRDSAIEVGPLSRSIAGDFKIIRDEDLCQVLYPAETIRGSQELSAEDAQVPLLGPDDESRGRCWHIDMPRGSVIRISLLLDKEPRQVIWRSVRAEHVEAVG